MRIVLYSLLLSLMLTPSPMWAEADKDEAASRKQLARKMFDVVGGEKRLNQILGLFIQSSATEYHNLYGKIEMGTTFRNDAQRERFMEEFSENQERFLAGLKMLLDERLNYAEVVIDVLVSIYADFYTEEELKQLLAFYQSPLGQKMIRELPQRLAQGNSEIMRRIGPRFQKIINEALEQEEQRLVASLSNK